MTIYTANGIRFRINEDLSVPVFLDRAAAYFLLVVAFQFIPSPSDQAPTHIWGIDFGFGAQNTDPSVDEYVTFGLPASAGRFPMTLNFKDGSTLDVQWVHDAETSEVAIYPLSPSSVSLPTDQASLEVFFSNLDEDTPATAIPQDQIFQVGALPGLTETTGVFQDAPGQTSVVTFSQDTDVIAQLGDGFDVATFGDGSDWITASGGSGGSSWSLYNNINSIYAGGGNDRIKMVGDGRAFAFGQDGDDYLTGGRFNDYFRGGNGNDIAVGYRGDDYLLGENGDDQLYGNSGNDFLAGGHGDDVLRGHSGDDTMTSSDGASRLYGGDGEDSIGVYQGQSFVFGDAGDDVLQLHYGQHRAFGGEGADHFVIRPGTESFTQIRDFAPGEDLLDLSRFAETDGYNPLMELAQTAYGSKLTLPDGDILALFGVAPEEFSAQDFTLEVVLF